MTTSADAENVPAPRASIWEDFVDIFVSPASVFERRRAGKFGIPLLVFLVVFGALSFASAGALGPAQAADSRRVMERLAADNPQMREAMQQSGASAGAPNPIVSSLAGMAMMAVSIFLAGLFTWIIGKLFGATASIGLVVMIVTYAQFPRILQQIVLIVQGFLLDPSQLTSMFRVSTSPARFMDPETTAMSTLIAASRLDPFLLWSTALIAIGLYVIGGLSKAEAAAVALIIWVLGVLPVLLPALLF